MTTSTITARYQAMSTTALGHRADQLARRVCEGRPVELDDRQAVLDELHARALAEDATRGTVNAPTRPNVVSVRGGAVHRPWATLQDPWPLCRTGSQMHRNTRYTTTNRPVTCRNCGPDNGGAR
ncbi:hypothetical protein [Amycolatopsis suaedae]|uniref:Uncharacterized protein n=1 Tax=Amycolatopsis suaedae TaxID=2510978 RepID=A0A4Q7IZB1_9PSEU|nr:hypothetical protein [Amycolatopsis suaedae]RZQ59807.1 hypothetical protein EWH70_32345 [Amycolatopsis suaedae]